MFNHNKPGRNLITHYRQMRQGLIRPQPPRILESLSPFLQEQVMSGIIPFITAQWIVKYLQPNADTNFYDVIERNEIAINPANQHVLITPAQLQSTSASKFMGENLIAKTLTPGGLVAMAAGLVSFQFILDSMPSGWLVEALFSSQGIAAAARGLIDFNRIITLGIFSGVVEVLLSEQGLAALRAGLINVDDLTHYQGYNGVGEFRQLVEALTIGQLTL